MVSMVPLIQFYPLPGAGTPSIAQVSPSPIYLFLMFSGMSAPGQNTDQHNSSVL